MLTVTKRFEFCYGHFLPGYAGKCKNLHGHNSVVEVEIAPTGIGNKVSIYEGGVAEVAKEYPGMVMDFSTIKEVVGPIIDQLDHKLLNDVPEFLKFCKIEGYTRDGRLIPTAEIICMFLVSEIKKQVPGLVRLRVSETPDSWAEWKMSEDPFAAVFELFGFKQEGSWRL